eukprot:366029-Chlamydomonas_euryale.AAC.19
MNVFASAVAVLELPKHTLAASRAGRARRQPTAGRERSLTSCERAGGCRSGTKRKIKTRPQVWTGGRMKEASMDAAANPVVADSQLRL